MSATYDITISTFSAAARAELARLEPFVEQQDDALNLPRVSAEFIHTLVLGLGARRAVEVGTSYGYSGLWIAAALEHNGGTLTTIDRDARKSAYARDALARAELDSVVTVLTGPAADVLADLDGPYDFVFLDADKENTRHYFDLFWPKLAQRATIVTDNVTSHADALRDFVDYLRKHPRLRSLLVPIGSGLELTHKLDPWRRTATLDGADWSI